MKRFFAFLSCLMLVPTLALASTGGYRCEDGVLRPHCCCPEEAEAAPAAAQQWEAQACCEFTPGTKAAIEHRCVEVSKGVDVSVLYIAQALPFEAAAQGPRANGFRQVKRPPPPIRVFLSLLI